MSNLVRPLRLERQYDIENNSSKLAEQNFQKAIQEGNENALEIILKQHNIPLDKPMLNGELPLHCATRWGKDKIVAMLLKKGAIPEQLDSQNLTAFDYAWAKDKKLFESLIKNLITKNLQSVNDWHNNDAHKIRQIFKKLNSLEEAPSSMPNFFKENFDPSNFSDQEISQKDANERTLLHLAILFRKEDIVKKLLIRKPDLLEMPDNQGNTPLHLAAATGDGAIFKTLLSNQPKVNCVNNEGFSPLHYAAAKNHLSFVRMLIEKGANFSLTGNSAISPLALIGVSCSERDPLRIHVNQILMSLGVITACIAAATFYLSGSFTYETYQQTRNISRMEITIDSHIVPFAMTLVSVAGGLLAHYIEWLAPRGKIPIKAKLIFVDFFSGNWLYDLLTTSNFAVAQNSLRYLGAFGFLRTAVVAHNTLNELAGSYQKRKLNREKAILKMTLHTFNAIASMSLPALMIYGSTLGNAWNFTFDISTPWGNFIKMRQWKM
jgi:ankyrin repeat protein